VGFAVGFKAQRTLQPATPPGGASAMEPAQRPEQPAEPPAQAPVPVVAEPLVPPRPAIAAPAQQGKRAATRAASRREARRGTLDVTAPEDADVLLDGRRIARGSVRVSIATGPHRIEVRRGGATARERFSVAPGETWTYSVKPAP
jgi:eukaryotic-like serine/threonine-protein kinase